MRCLLDTNIVSELVKGKNRSVAARAAAYGARYGRFTFSLLTRYEVTRGLKANNASRLLARFHALSMRCIVLPLTRDVVDVAADLWADLKRAGQLIEDDDIFIAATALHLGLVLATGNLAYFNRIPGLILDDWTQP